MSGNHWSVLISAAEASSDLHGAHLLRELRKVAAERGATLDAFGIGGPRLREEGLRAVAMAEELRAMGTSEVLGRLPIILRAMRSLTREAELVQPHVGVLIDYPDFHFKVAARLARARIPLVYYIPPKIWVWRRDRLRVMRKLFKQILCIFPFEPEIYAKQGVSARYVGNPISDELPLSLTREDARAQLGIAGDERVLALLPGSRPAELARHLSPMLGAAELAASHLPGGLRVKVALPEGVAELASVTAQVREAQGRSKHARFEVSAGDSARVLIAADAGLVKSGTSTLEAAVLGCPHVVVYQPSPATGWVFRNVIQRRYKGPVGLVNLFTGWKEGDSLRAPELLMGAMTIDAMADAIVMLLTQESVRARMKSEFAKLREEVLGGSRDGGVGPSRRAAEAVADILSGGGRGMPARAIG